MGSTDRVNAEIDEIIRELKESFATTFATPSYDELLKFAAVKDLYSMTLRNKDRFVRLNERLKILPSEEYISYMLTLIKLISVNGQEMLMKYIISNVDPENNFIEGKMEQVLYSYNKILATEYEKYNPLLTNIVFINHVYNADRVNSGSSPVEKQRRRHLKIDYAISKYREGYSDDNKELIREIIVDIDNHEELKTGKRY